MGAVPHTTTLGNVMELTHCGEHRPDDAAAGGPPAPLARVGMSDRAAAFPIGLTDGLQRRVADAGFPAAHVASVSPSAVSIDLADRRAQWFRSLVL